MGGELSPSRPSCLLAATALTTQTTRHPHTENTNLSVSTDHRLCLFIPAISVLFFLAVSLSSDS